MTFLRHANRHIHATVADYVKAQLNALNWNTTPPFGAAPVYYETFLPRESELTKVKPGLVAITMGGELIPRDEELGGPLHSQNFPMAVNVFQDKDAWAVALANDVRDALRGRFPGGKRMMNVQDHTASPPVDVAGWQLEFIDVEGDRVDLLPIYWQTVQFIVEVTFPEELY